MTKRFVESNVIRCSQCGCELTRMRIHRHGKVYCYECNEMLNARQKPSERIADEDDARLRRIIRWHHSRGMTVSELSEKYGISKEQVYERLK